MKLLIIVLCLLSERFLIHSFSSSRFAWYGNYYLVVKKHFSSFFSLLVQNKTADNPWLLLAVGIFPLLILISCLYFLVDDWFYGLIGFFINLFIFFYCLGPQNVFYPAQQGQEVDAYQSGVGNYLAEANSQLFSPIFWYLVGGPMILLLYRIIYLSQLIASVKEPAYQLTAFFEWLPARITSLLYLLAGNFQKGFTQFRHFLLANPATNHQMLTECGLQAVLVHESDEAIMPAAENLVEHALIIFLVAIAIITLVASL